MKIPRQDISANGVEPDGDRENNQDLPMNISDVNTEPSLSALEREQLIVCEKLISINLKSFTSVGAALKTIRDRKLYRATHASFEDYCRHKFDLSRAQGYRLITGAEAVRQIKLSPIGDKINLATESQARELAKIEPDKRIEVMQRAITNVGAAPLTANSIKMAGREILEFQNTTKSPAGVTKQNRQLTMAEADFLGWLKLLKECAVNNRNNELLRLLTAAEKKRGIVLE